MKKLGTMFLFGFLLFSFKHIVRPAAHGAVKAGKVAYKAVI